MTRTRAFIAVLCIVACMYAYATVLHEKETIFPEIAALGIGAWVLRNPAWIKCPWRLWLSPTLAAATGIGIVHFLPFPREILIGIAFIAVIFELEVCRSKVMPSVSAAILPIITFTDSLYYLLSVSVLAAVIASVATLTEEKHAQKNQPPLPLAPSPAFRKKAFHWLLIFIPIFSLAVIAARSSFLYLLAPPLIVTLIEFVSSTNTTLRSSPMRLWSLLTLSAFWGVFSVEAFHLQLFCPLAVTSVIILIGLFLLYRYFILTFPPAAAISLLPTIVPPESLLTYPIQVSAGSLLLIMAGIWIASLSGAKPSSDTSQSRANTQ